MFFKLTEWKKNLNFFKVYSIVKNPLKWAF